MKAKIIKVCGICGKEFLVYPSQTKRKFCSNRCKFKAPRKYKVKPRIIKICETCKKEFDVIPSKKSRRFCSWECRVKAPKNHTKRGLRS